MNLLIGIDPGTNTGLAVWGQGELLLVKSGTAVEVESYILDRLKTHGVKLRIEDARKRTWFGKAGRERLKGVGSVNRDCSRWQEFLEHHEIEFSMIHPKNNRTKLSAFEFKRLTGWAGRTNDHARDAAMLIYQG
ncbi:MAG: hypothetical protein JKY67_02780 [Pseudomonadales bacterium]|nr:hypothetical protein [Pseudomonadales bacterium]